MGALIGSERTPWWERARPWAWFGLPNRTSRWGRSESLPESLAAHAAFGDLTQEVSTDRSWKDDQVLA
jgi:hypothetical protein